MDNWAGRAKINLAKYHFQTLITAPLFPISSLRKIWPGAKLFTIESKMSLNKINFSRLSIISFPNFYLASLPLLIRLERAFEKNFKQARIILVFDQNLKQERLYNQLKESYFLKRLIYLPDPGRQSKPNLFFSLLSENQQLILQQISQKNLQSFFYQKNELDYLLKTGIIKKTNHTLSTLKVDRALKNYLQLSFPGQEKEVNLKKVTSHLSLQQQKGLEIFAKNQDKIINREKLAHHLWGENYEYSDYALDQYISRLRKKLTNLGFSSCLKTIKKEGFIFNISKPNTKRIKYQGLEFIPFSPDSKLLRFHLREFKKPQTRQNLFTFTPKSKDQIKAWLNNLIYNPAFAYWLITKNNHPLGHIGLKMINQKEKQASIGTFLKHKRYLQKHGKTIYRFILHRGQKRNLKIIFKDICQYPQTTTKILKKLGFKKSARSSHFFFLNNPLQNGQAR
ncbi:winged helix-turn-helix domain-containing protein [Candidatus Shapirobacteria bacterium]|nr:winged helix-turn-helix domain-containing protein [Candidatus Shapirobacteria bacterium]